MAKGKICVVHPEDEKMRKRKEKQFKDCVEEDDIVRKKRKKGSSATETGTVTPVPLQPKKKCHVEDLEEAKSKTTSEGYQVKDCAKPKTKKHRKKISKTEDVEHSVADKEREEDPEHVEQLEEELSPEERRTLERKLKKLWKQEEKRRLKAEGKTEKKTEVQKVTAAQKALEYLSSWSEKRKEWKFQKTRQTWLLQNMFDTEKVADKDFSVLLSYLEGLRGAARETTAQKAESVVRESEGEGGGEAQRKAQRARDVVQLLS